MPSQLQLLSASVGVVGVSFQKYASKSSCQPSVTLGSRETTPPHSCDWYKRGENGGSENTHLSAHRSRNLGVCQGMGIQKEEGQCRGCAEEQRGPVSTVGPANRDLDENTEHLQGHSYLYAIV